MDKNSARNSITSAGLSSRDIAHSIYLATVQGISGANQNGGMGFALSAIAELWNIRGVVGNPNARTKITGRYRGMNVTEQMILNVISKYPSGFNGSQPLFDDLLGIGMSGNNNNRQSVYDDFGDYHNTSTPTSGHTKVDPYEDAYADFEGWDDDDSASAPTEVDDYVDAYAEFEDEDDIDDNQSFGVSSAQPSSGVVSSQNKVPTRFSDAEVRSTASLSVSMALSMVKELTGKDLSSIKEVLIENAISIIREMGY